MSELPQILAELFGALPPVALAAVMFGLGALFLLFGWPVYRVSVVVLGVMIGAAMGAGIGHLLALHPIILAIPLGLLVGLLALSLQKIGAFLAIGLCAAVLVLTIADVAEAGHGIWIAAALAFVTAGTLAVLLWKPMVTLGMAVIGATLIANAVYLSAEQISPGAAPAFIAAHPNLAAASVAFIAIIGVLFQRADQGPSPPPKKHSPAPRT